MKNLLSISCLLFVVFFMQSVQVQGQYRLNKEKYGHLPYQFQRTDPYRPLHSIVASALLPGFGHAIADEPLRGLAFFGVYAVSAFTMTQSALYMLTGEPDLSLRTETANIVLITSSSVAILTCIVAAVDAGRVARVNSLAWRDKNQLSQLRLYPHNFVNSQNGNLAPGVTLVWGF